jgi:hypothetical protein
MSSRYEFVYKETFSFPLTPAQLWRELECPDRLTGRWSWVDVLRFYQSLEPGSELSCVIKPPVPFRILLDVEVVEISPGALVGIALRGDLEGRGELRLSPDGGDTLVEVSWRFVIRDRRIRAVARHAHSVLRWGHDRIVEAAVHGFRKHLEAPKVA